MTDDKETIRLLKAEIQDLQDEILRLKEARIRRLKMPRRGNGRRSIYPFRKIGIGQCFTAPMSKRDSIDSIARRFSRDMNWKFCVRPVDEATIGVWRVA